MTGAARDRGHDDTGEDNHGGEVGELRPGMGGTWLVRSRAQTTHAWDLDAMTYRRRPGAGSSAMAHDDVTVAITAVGRWPAVGQSSLVYFDDPGRHAHGALAHLLAHPQHHPVRG